MGAEHLPDDTDAARGRDWTQVQRSGGVADAPKSHWWGEAQEAIAESAALRVEVDRLRTQLAEYENGITWGTSCLSCARVLDSAYRDTVRADVAESVVDAIRALVGYSGLSVNADDPAVYCGHEDQRPAFVAGWNYAMRDYDARIRAITDPPTEENHGN